MPLKDKKTSIQRWFLFISSGSAILVLVVSYLAMNIYLRSVARELIDAWSQAEAIALQEGNFLSAISKGQRILTSSDFIQGIRLYDKKISEKHPIAEFGNPFKPSFSSFAQLWDVQQISVFKFIAIKKLSSERDIYGAFLVQPSTVPWMFGASTSLIVILVCSGLYSIKSIENKEARQRAKVLKMALNSLVSGTGAVDILYEYSPNFISSWEELQGTVERMKAKERRLAAEAAFVKLAREIAHDIRSPLSALKTVKSLIKKNPEGATNLLEKSISRVNSIAEDLLRQSRMDQRQEGPSNKINGGDVIKNSSESFILSAAIEEIVEEKHLSHFDGKNIRISIFNEIKETVLHVERTRFQRVLSNLIQNAIEAIEIEGFISISATQDGEDVLIEVRDNGKGISEQIVQELHENPRSFNKPDGNGLGLASARSFVEGYGGSLLIESTVGQGTLLSLRLPIPKI